MNEADLKRLGLYLESVYDAMGRSIPLKADGGVDVQKALALVAHWEAQGSIMPYPAWVQRVYGESQEREFVWPPELPCPSSAVGVPWVGGIHVDQSSIS